MSGPKRKEDRECYDFIQKTIMDELNAALEVFKYKELASLLNVPTGTLAAWVSRGAINMDFYPIIYEIMGEASKAAIISKVKKLKYAEKIQAKYSKYQ